MQDGGFMLDLNEDYINKLNYIIEFYKAEKEFNLHYIIKGEEDSKFHSTLFISIIVGLIAITNLMYLLDKFPKLYISILILFTLILLFIVLCGNIMTSKLRKEYINKSIRYYFLINYFSSLKVLPYEVNLSSVIDTIKKKYHVKTGFMEWSMFLNDNWYEEILDCLENINKEIVEKQNNKP